MFGKKGVKSNRKKLKIYTKGKGISIHRLNAVRKKVTLPKKKRNEIRAAVKECEVAYQSGMDLKEYLTLLRSTYGRARHLKQFHAVPGSHLIERLSKINNTGYKL